MDLGPRRGHSPGTPDTTEHSAVVVGWFGADVIVMILDGDRRGQLFEVAPGFLTFAVSREAEAAAMTARAQRAGLVTQ